MVRGVYADLGRSLAGEYHTQPGISFPMVVDYANPHKSFFLSGQSLTLKKGGNAFNVAATRK